MNESFVLNQNIKYPTVMLKLLTTLVCIVALNSVDYSKSNESLYDIKICLLYTSDAADE